jgi:hypothetical protein
MGKWSYLLGQGLLVGSLAWTLSGTAVAQAPVTDTTTTTTSTTMVAPAGGYYDASGIFHSGISPYAGGSYDQAGVWHPGTVVTAYTSTTTYVAPDRPDMYNSFHYNYYAGYGAMYELNRGYTYVLGPDGLRHEVDLNANRTLVRLTNDNTLEPRLDVARGFDRGLIEVPDSSFDPMRLDIPTGRTVTFYSDVGAHTIEPMDGHSFNQSVIITPNTVFSWTFTQPGLYRFDDSFGGGPTGSHLQGLIIRVHGDAVAWDDSAFADAEYVQTVSSISTEAVQTYNSVTTTTMPETAETQQTTQNQTIQVQGQKTQAPVKKVHKTVLRNTDLK